MGPGEQLGGGVTGAPGQGDAAGLGRCCVNACGARTLPRGNSFFLHPFSAMWLMEMVPRGPSDDKRTKNGDLAMSGLEVSSLS